MTWWLWVLVAAVLAVAEMSGPGFFVIFFSAGALVTAAVLAAAPSLSLWGQLAVFVAVSVLALLLLRRRLVGRFGHNSRPAEGDDLLRGIAVVLDDLAPGAVGKAELRGVPWTARNADEAVLPKGRRCKVVKVDGLTLLLKAE